MKIAVVIPAHNEAWDFSTQNGIHPVAAQDRLKVCPFEAHDGISATAKLVVGNAPLTHVAVQRARGDMKEFRCLGFVEQPVVVRFGFVHEANHGSFPQRACSVCGT